jgi:myo-inositol-1(or 4)-monophosphatase
MRHESRMVTRAPDGGHLSSEDRELVELALAAAFAASEVLISRFREPAIAVHTKSSPVDLVSEVDFAAEAAILDLIAGERGSDSILSEERGIIEGSSGVQWIIDPLDGTHNFLNGIPLWCVSIAVADAEGIRVGVVGDPLHEEYFLGVRGRGSMLNGTRLPLRSPRVRTGEMVLAGSCRRAVTPGTPRYTRLGRFVAEFGNTRELIAAALELAWTAAGRMDALYHESKIKLVDKAAGVLLCREAGLAVHELTPAPDGERERLLVCPLTLSDQLLAEVG